MGNGATAVEQEAAEKIAAKELEEANLKECLLSREVGNEISDVKLRAVEQFKNAKEEVKCVRRATSLKNISSVSELVGLGGILHEKRCESWMYVDKMLEGLNTNRFLEKWMIYYYPTKYRLGVIKSLREENLLEPLNGIQTVNWLEKFNDISSIDSQLDAIRPFASQGIQ
ncbi:hypothetical protein OROGR_004796 [Orobanche gracilis]